MTGSRGRQQLPDWMVNPVIGVSALALALVDCTKLLCGVANPRPTSVSLDVVERYGEYKSRTLSMKGRCVCYLLWGDYQLNTLTNNKIGE